jgi:hypothetical protein
MTQIKKGTIIVAPLMKMVVTRILVELMTDAEHDGLPPATKIKLRVFESTDEDIPPASTINISARGLQVRFKEAQWRLG